MRKSAILGVINPKWRIFMLRFVKSLSVLYYFVTKKRYRSYLISL